MKNLSTLLGSLGLVQGGPQKPVIRRVIGPYIGIITPVTHLFWAIYKGEITPFTTSRGPPCFCSHVGCFRVLSSRSVTCRATCKKSLQDAVFSGALDQVLQQLQPMRRSGEIRC